ncbi:hypothetical protein [Novosphingobium sp. Chol11]|uniref:hypothetical protein n=1 Tax=Novosphingobium sp. Chol11 TaxID=1385763 RepID=UPI0025FF6E91|nr:hypothetical protein [Novosphingobium sp. Chol11]
MDPIASLGRPLTAAFACALLAASGTAFAVPDLGKRACAQEARRLCPAEMRTLSRKRVEACMIAKVDQTSAICHAAMLRIKAERESMAKAKVQPSLAATGKP